jgi:hypothetical protein
MQAHLEFLLGIDHVRNKSSAMLNSSVEFRQLIGGEDKLGGSLESNSLALLFGMSWFCSRAH